MRKVRIRGLSRKGLLDISGKMVLSLNGAEMEAVKKYYEEQSREPSLMEMEIIAQTWSEHCKHKTMGGPVEYTRIDISGEEKKENINSLLKETVFRTARELDRDYCLSVFEDNAGVIRFDSDSAIAIKAETHNHPSAIEPYGGAATGVGGVIRDILGCGRGARPFMNLDVFCFGPCDTPREEIEGEVLHPERIFKGVVKGVRDYGNRVGIPTLSGAIIFDRDYIYNPLVYCGTLGIMPVGHIEKKVRPGDVIISIGGRTGRDGIHGATFSSAGLQEETDSGCVQIGDPVTEKKFADAMLKLRDMNLYEAVTDCGAGGFSSAIGEMGSETGALVRLENAPLKYEGLKPWEIFLSESQERMVLSVSPGSVEALGKILDAEDVEWARLGEFTSSGRLEVYYKEKKHADLDMEFLHGGLPRIKRKAVWREKPSADFEAGGISLAEAWKKVMGDLNVASKERVIREYDHEVQGGTVLKPLAGKEQDAPQDGCAVMPQPGSKRAVAVGLGINPSYGRLDPYKMALSCSEEAARNTVAAGGDMKKAAFMDNFCWGDTRQEEVLGGLVRASRGCYRASMDLGIPFVSGKDSLNNFYETVSQDGERKKVNIPGTLLITCAAVSEDAGLAVGSDFKKPGNFIYQVGRTYNEMGGSVLSRVSGRAGGGVPDLRPECSRGALGLISSALRKKTILSVHDISEGGFIAALSEMCFSGVGASVDICGIKLKDGEFSERESDLIKLFSESNSRFLVEVEPERAEDFEKLAEEAQIFRIGETTFDEQITVNSGLRGILREDIGVVKKIWKSQIDE